MDPHEVTVTSFTEQGSTLYEISIKARDHSENRTYATLEAALDSFSPPLSARVRSHVVEGIRGEGKPVMFCLEDSFARGHAFLPKVDG